MTLVVKSALEWKSQQSANRAASERETGL